MVSFSSFFVFHTRKETSNNEDRNFTLLPSKIYCRKILHQTARNTKYKHRLFDDRSGVGLLLIWSQNLLRNHGYKDRCHANQFVKSNQEKTHVPWDSARSVCAVKSVVEPCPLWLCSVVKQEVLRRNFVSSSKVRRMLLYLISRLSLCFIFGSLLCYLCVSVCVYV